MKNRLKIGEQELIRELRLLIIFFICGFCTLFFWDYLFWMALFQDWELLLCFNYMNEGIFEFILLHFISGVMVIVWILLIKDLFKRKKELEKGGEKK